MRRSAAVSSPAPLAVLALASTCLRAQNAASSPVPADAPYKNASLPVEQRVTDLLTRMSLDEKVSMLAGSGWMESMPVPRLGFRRSRWRTGRWAYGRGWAARPSPRVPLTVKIESTSFPSGVCMAATWDTGLVQKEGQAIAQEVKALGRDMILGPTVNINRQPLWGRNFEGYGEDPYLSGKLGVAYIRGVQGEGVIPSVKHFAANNEEFERHRINETISERALREIYLPAFKAAVQEGGVWNVMSAYQLVNGVHMAEHAPLLRDVLQGEFGFQGFVISDWGSTYSTAPTVNAGMALEMPGGDAAKNLDGTAQTAKSGNGDLWPLPDKVMRGIARPAILLKRRSTTMSRACCG